MTELEREPRDRPVLRTFVKRGPGRYRSKWAPEDAEGPSVRDGGIVRVSVGAGLRPQDIPRTVALAQAVRNAAVVEIIGDSRRAVDHARRVFLAAWDVDLPEAAGSGSVAAWAALMLAQPRDDGKDAAL